MTEPTPTPTPVLEDLCTWHSCLHAGKGEYRLEAHCRNCGQHAIVRLTKGHDRPGYRQGPECPACGCRDWHWGGMVASLGAAS